MKFDSDPNSVYHSTTVTASLFRILARSCALTLAASCSNPKPADTPATTPPTQRSSSGETVQQGTQRGSLAPFASEALIVLPAQRLRASVSDWAAKVRDEKSYLSTIDDEIAFAIRERGLKGQWAFPADLARAAKRNPGYTADPYNVAVGALAAVERDPEKIIGEPLGSQLRAFGGLFNARYALIPVEVRLSPDSSGGRASVHLAVADTRASRLAWKGDVSGDGARTFTPAVAAGLAGRVADLFFTPAR